MILIKLNLLASTQIVFNGTIFLIVFSVLFFSQIVLIEVNISNIFTQLKDNEMYILFINNYLNKRNN